MKQRHPGLSGANYHWYLLTRIGQTLGFTPLFHFIALNTTVSSMLIQGHHATWNGRREDEAKEYLGRDNICLDWKFSIMFFNATFELHWIFYPCLAWPLEEVQMHLMKPLPFLVGSYMMQPAASFSVCAQHLHFPFIQKLGWYFGTKLLLFLVSEKFGGRWRCIYIQRQLTMHRRKVGHSYTEPRRNHPHFGANHFPLTQRVCPLTAKVFWWISSTSCVKCIPAYIKGYILPFLTTNNPD